MPKFFVVSDVHGFFTEMKEALDNAGFDSNNKNHWLICCGDLLDRGHEAVQMIDFWNHIERKVLVRGNHEILFKELCQRKYAHGYDWHNGTMQTVIDLSTTDYDCDTTYQQAISKFSPLLNTMVNFFETQNYIFIHSTIPYWLGNSWRNATDEEWNDAMWGNPFDFWETIEIENKTAVFGHWHTSDYNSPLHKFDEQANFGIAYGEGFIGIDACTAFSHKVNVLVIEDEFLIKE